MSRSLTVRQAKLVLPDRTVTGDLVVEDGVITEIAPHATRAPGVQIDGTGLAVLPGVVDTHVRLDAVEDINRIAPALLAGGITSIVAVRQANTARQLQAELAAVAEHARVHYGLYVRCDEGFEAALEAEQALGIWVDAAQLPDADPLFAQATGLVVVDHRDNDRLTERWHLWDVPPTAHDLPRFYDIDTCVAGTQRVLELAARHGTRTHLLHPTTAEELALLPDTNRVTAAVRPSHLFADASLVDTIGTRAVCVPPLRGPRHTKALWQALRDGKLWIASGHFPASAASKDVPLPDTHPGWPTAEWLLPLLLDDAASGRCTLADIATWTADAPARGLGLRRKGRLETGFDGDLVLVDLSARRTIGVEAPIRTVAGWCPWDGQTLQGWPVRTVLSGRTAWVHGEMRDVQGQSLSRF